MNIDTLITKIVQHIINPTIVLIFALALVYFMLGVFKFIKGAENPGDRATGVNHITWGIIGMFVMVSAFAIIRIVLGTFDVPVPSGLR